ncbi:MAG: hypothetical protein J7D61_07780 [Marichromatium sp.]|nr:hypothetical protein [Marichromatium sp.]
MRVIVLKGRQQGLSTVIEGLLYWYVSQNQGIRGLVVAHKSDSTNALFTMTRRYHDNVPAVLKPSTTYSSRKELVFDKLDSSIIVGTAGSDGLGRGETIQFLHASELAFWPSGSVAEIWSGLMDTMPPVPNSFAIVESTAFGNSGVYHDLWQRAKQGTTEFMPVFIPWIVQEEYAYQPPAGFERTFEEDEYAQKAQDAYGDQWWFRPITDAQLYWRRMKIGEKGASKFQQEYPLTDDEAFQSSGMQVFAPEHVAAQREDRAELISQKLLMGDRWEESRAGSLRIYRPIQDNEEYYIGVDVGHGISTSRADADWSVACVLDSRKEQVAQLRARILPGDFARWVYYLGMLYNEAEVCVENAGPGYHVCQRLARDYLYPHLYTEEVFDKVSEEFTTKLGFTTSVKSKPLVINKIRDALSHNQIHINDPDTLEEMRTFVVNETGKYAADAGAHDDTVMALALALHIHKGPRAPVTDYDLWDVEEGADTTASGDLGLDDFVAADPSPAGLADAWASL